MIQVAYSQSSFFSEKGRVKRRKVASPRIALYRCSLAPTPRRSI